MTATETKGQVRGTLLEKTDDALVLGLPGTDYRIHLVPTIHIDEITTPPGKRLAGTIEARALKVHRTSAGGRFIEPVWGAPRIVQGTIVTIETGRVLVQTPVAMWITLPEGQASSDFATGQMVNFYVESGVAIRIAR